MPSNWGDRTGSRTATAAHKRHRARILRRDGYVCQLHYAGCLGRATELDHIINVAAGGSDDDSNLQAACHPCHQTKTLQEAAAGREAKRARLRLPTQRHPGEL